MFAQSSVVCSIAPHLQQIRCVELGTMGAYDLRKRN
jgi:hypothetical protein